MGCSSTKVSGHRPRHRALIRIIRQYFPASHTPSIFSLSSIHTLAING